MRGWLSARVQNWGYGGLTNMWIFNCMMVRGWGVVSVPLTPALFKDQLYSSIAVRELILSRDSLHVLNRLMLLSFSAHRHLNCLLKQQPKVY